MDIKYICEQVDKKTKGFMTGDDCWILIGEYNYEDCDLCNGKPLIVPINGTETEVICPKCKGAGYIEKGVMHTEKRTIENIFVSVTVLPDRLDIIVRFTVSGISIYMTQNEVFKTEEESQKEADRINRENDRRI